jgi:penicillin-insensitive murein DD-endopeptidase
MNVRALLRSTFALAALAISACSIPSAVSPSFSGSVGVPHAGFLTNGVELPKEGKGYRWKSAADHHFGLPRMVSLLKEASASVAEQRPSTPPVYIGEISAKGGGALLPKHRSHRTGRDVDVMFFVTTLEGAPVAGTGFTKFGPDGLGVDTGGRFLRFDTDREWLFIKGLLSSKEAHVQWIFIARLLEAVIIEHAIALGEPTQLVAMAEQVMQQPGDSLPHDDHIHVRLACEPDEFARGCDGGGPRWAWLPAVSKFEASPSELVDALLGPSVAPEGDTPVAALP